MPKSVTRTMRLEVELDKALTRRASNEKISVNFLVNRCLRKYVEWDAPMLGIGLALIPKVLLNHLADGGDETVFEGYGREVARDFLRPGVEYAVGEYSVANVIEALRRASIYSGRFNFDLVDGKDSMSHVLFINHGQGRLWSKYYEGLLDETFRVLLGEELKVASTESNCIAQLRLR